MTKFTYRLLGLLFGIMTLGGISETYRIITSSAPDIAPRRGELTVMAILMMVIFIFLTRFFWRKGKVK